jgi:hypothetical protein
MRSSDDLTCLSAYRVTAPPVLNALAQFLDILCAGSICRTRHASTDLLGRNAELSFEVAGQMALVGESYGARDLGQRALT